MTAPPGSRLNGKDRKGRGVKLMAPWFNQFKVSPGAEIRENHFCCHSSVQGGHMFLHDLRENMISICALSSADCQPPCQNRGSCSRPHTCVCRSGFQGPRCEEVAPEQVYIREGGGLRRVQPGTNPFQRDQPQRRPAEKATDTVRVQTPRPATTRQPVHPV